MTLKVWFDCIINFLKMKKGIGGKFTPVQWNRTFSISNERLESKLTTKVLIHLEHGKSGKMNLAKALNLNIFLALNNEKNVITRNVIISPTKKHLFPNLFRTPYLYMQHVDVQENVCKAYRSNGYQVKFE